MKWFNKKKTDSTLPPEVKAFSEAEHRERVGMAWLVGIISLIVTVLVLSLLYLGGAWMYRKLAHKDPKPENKPTTTQPLPSDQNTPKPDDNDKTATSSDSTNQPAKVTKKPKTQPKTQPNTGPSGNEELIRTGPDIDL